MIMKKIILTITTLICASFALSAQNVSVYVSEADEKMQTGSFEPTWESLRTYQVPEWFRDAKFGIWAHWGPQCVEGSGDWMARGLYDEGSKQYKYHREHYGHPSEFGFKDVLPLFKAENWDPDRLVAFYKEIGAEYFFCLGNHHDNFDLWESSYQEWNSVAIGPHRDILAGWEAAARKYGLPFGISFHADHAWTWYEFARRFDLEGDMIGVKYDGWLTKEDGYVPNADGSEKWWKGLDPQKLYQQKHDFSKHSWGGGDVGDDQWSWKDGASIPSQEFVTNFYNRTLEAVNRYNPDLVYFDATVLPFYPFSDAGLKITAHIYNHNAAQHNGKNEAVVFGKILDEEQKQAMVWDVERGAPNQIVELPWQCCNCIGNWHYNTSYYERDRYKSAATIVKLLVDIVSKNGNMLLSVPLRGDGTFDEKEEAILKEFGAWMKVNKESIHGTRPWEIFGEGPIASQSIAIKNQGFNDNNYVKADYREIRFTKKDGVVYATALGWPENHKIEIKAMAEGSRYLPGRITKIELLGYGKVKFTRTANALVVELPEEPCNNIAPVLKIR